MKNSIRYLPKNKQEELNFLIDEVLKALTLLKASYVDACYIHIL